MDLGLQYEIQRSRPHYPGFMYDIYHQATEQVILADKLGFHSVWTVEHHFLNEWSYSSAPEVWYGALSQVTKNIRLGHGVSLLPIPFNHPVRVAERIAVLNIMSNGRVECGTGRCLITEQELGGFNINPEDSRPMWEEAVAQIPKMWTQEIYQGFQGKYFQIPPREVIPKPIQKPHPAMWVAATQPSTWEVAGHKGIGALGFGISEPGVIDKLVATYKKAISNCEPVGSFVNDRVAAGTGMRMRPDPRGSHRARQGRDRFHHSQGCGTLHSGFYANKDALRSYEYYKKMAQQAVAIGDYRMSTESLQKRIDSGSVMVGDPEDCLKVAKQYQSAGVDLLMALVQVAALPQEEGDADHRAAGEARAKPKVRNGASAQSAAAGA